MALAKLSLKGRALRLLSAREHSRAELERKLGPFEEAAGTLAAALDDLQSKGFISETRVVDSVVHRRAPKLGTQRIRQELQAKGVSAEGVAQAMSGLRHTELARAHEVWLKKFGTPPSDTTEAARQVRFLATRGFAGDVIRRVVKGEAAAQLALNDPGDTAS